MQNDPDSQIAYQFYGYLNLAHVLTHKGDNGGLEYSMADLEKSGLIQTKQERKLLEDIAEYESKSVQAIAVIAWIGSLFELCVENGNIREVHTTEFNRNLGKLRGSMATTADISGDTPALSWAVTMVNYALIKHLA